MRYVLFLSSLFLLLPVSVHAEEKESISVIARPIRNAVAITAGVATAYNSAYLTDERLVPITRFTTNQPKNLLNHFKGDLGENLMDNVYTKTFLDRTGRWVKLTPTLVGRKGIDGLYIKLNSNGMPVDCLISEAKMDGSKLSLTKDGKQMSETWIRPRVARTAKTYRTLSQELQFPAVARRASRGSDVPSDAISVPIRGNTSVEIWKTDKGYEFLSADDSVTVEDIQRQARRCAQWLEGVANGNCRYRARKFTYKALKDEHEITISCLDHDGNVVRSRTAANESQIRVQPQTIRGKYENLPTDIQRAIRGTARETLRLHKDQFGLNTYDSDSMVFDKTVKECCNNPQKFNELCVKSKLSPSIIRGGATLLSAMALVGILDPVTQYMETGTVDWKRSGYVTLLTGAAVPVGQATSSFMASRGGLLATRGARMLSGGGAAAVFVAGGMYILGYANLPEARDMVVDGCAGAGLAATPTAMMAAASYFGTASTEVAISTLHGAAATSASLAFWGGGSVAAGGGGMAAGSAVIGVATGGVALVVTGGYAVWQTYKYFRDKKSQHTFVEELIHLTQDRVREGRQGEWPLLAR